MSSSLIYLKSGLKHLYLETKMMTVSSVVFITSKKLSDWFGFGFVALRPKSTAMVIAGRSVHLTTLFPGQA